MYYSVYNNFYTHYTFACSVYMKKIYKLNINIIFYVNVILKIQNNSEITFIYNIYVLLMLSLHESFSLSDTRNLIIFREY